MGYDTGIATRLRNAGLPVVECSGWQSRGSSSFNPRGSVNHHTAGPSSGATPSLNTCINGRPDLSGPLCNVFQSREPDGNDKAYVVAAGTANHAGSGGWKGLSGNSSVYGLEIEHTGTSPLSEGRQRIAAAIHAAIFGGDVSYVCQHYEWTTRKIDAATNVNGNTFRQYVADARAGRGPTPEPPPPPEDEEDYVIIFTCSGKPQYSLSGGKAAGIKSSSTSSAIQKLKGFGGLVTLDESTYNEWIAKYRDGKTGA